MAVLASGALCQSIIRNMHTLPDMLNEEMEKGTACTTRAKEICIKQQ